MLWPSLFYNIAPQCDLVQVDKTGAVPGLMHCQPEIPDLRGTFKRKLIAGFETIQILVSHLANRQPGRFYRFAIPQFNPVIQITVIRRQFFGAIDRKLLWIAMRKRKAGVLSLVQYKTAQFYGNSKINRPYLRKGIISLGVGNAIDVMQAFVIPTFIISFPGIPAGIV